MSVQTDPRANLLIAKAVRAIGSQERLAELAGLSQSTISRLVLGEVRVSAEHAIAIDRATQGAVPKWLLRPDLWDAPEREVA